LAPILHAPMTSTLVEWGRTSSRGNPTRVRKNLWSGFESASGSDSRLFVSPLSLHSCMVLPDEAQPSESACCSYSLDQGELRTLLRGATALECLDDQALEALLPHVRSLRVSDGANIVHPRDRLEYIFVVSSGTVELSLLGNPFESVGSGGVFAETAMNCRATRDGHVFAQARYSASSTGACKLVAIPIVVLAPLLRVNRQCTSALVGLFKARKAEVVQRVRRASEEESNASTDNLPCPFAFFRASSSEGSPGRPRLASLAAAQRAACLVVHAAKRTPSCERPDDAVPRRRSSRERLHRMVHCSQG